MRGQIQTIVLSLMLQQFGIYCYKYFQNRIPNGESVPHPCKPNYIWHGVGHLNERGGGRRNQFGLDFLNSGSKWTKTLCKKDSDEDGKSNGEELGDPTCVWTEDEVPMKTTGLSHPGVCEPIDSDFCKSRNLDLDCDLEDFKCDAVTEDPDIRNFTVRFPPTAVPAKETNYYCMSFNFDVDGDFHMVATQPIIDNTYVMHHILLLGCQDEVVVNSTPTSCGMSLPGCFNIIGIWTIGKNGECLKENIGFRIGNKGFKIMALQFHWNNPEMKSDYIDSSGMVLYYTTNTRLYDAGVLLVGQEYIEIPPKRQEVMITAECSSEVTKQIIVNGSIHFTGAFNHMHYLGRRMKMEHYRDGVKVRDITNDELYSYDDPFFYEFQNSIEFKPGDSLKTTCVYKSTNRNSTVFWGDGTSDEMCYGFITFYPVQNMLRPSCTSWKGIPWATFGLFQEIGGCRFQDFMNVSHPYYKSITSSVSDNCPQLSHCLSECKDIVKEVKTHPCLSGDINDFIRLTAIRWKLETLLTFYSKLDSCDVELQQQEPGNTAPQYVSSLIGYLLVVLATMELL